MKVQFPLIVSLLSINLIYPALGTKIDAELQKKIDSAPPGSTWNIIILFKQDPTLLTPTPPNPNPEESHISAYNSMLKLKKHADESQSSVISEIKSFIAARSSKNVRITSHWCTKTVSVYSASKDLVDLLGVEGKPEHENITVIVEDEAIDIDDKIGKRMKIPKGRQTGKGLLDDAWGLKKIDAKAWWDAGYNGTGVIVGHIDDGVDINHPSLKYNWVGKGDGWYVPGDINSTFPYEGSTLSHGTHTIGTIIGRGNGVTGNESDVDFYGVGVAPGARWMSCSMCDPNIRNPRTNESACLNAHLASCLEFLYCPNKENQCLYRPNVISVSRGCRQKDNVKCGYKGMFDPCITALRNEGVIPVFSGGNEGVKGCQTIGEPGDNEDVIAVGNIDESDTLAEDSSMGPPKWRYNETEIDARAIYKPDLVAPGTIILSTVTSGPQGEFRYGYMSGSSMAAPHVAGAVALLLSRTKDLTFVDVRDILKISAVNNTQLKSTNPNVPCGRKQDSSLLNHKFGFGRLLMPDLNSELMKVTYPEKRPTRKMPPPPDFGGASPRPVLPGMVGVVIMMISIGFLMDAALEI